MGVNMRDEKLKEIDKYIEKFKTIKKSEPFESEGFISVKNYEIELNNGKTIHREQIYKNGRIGNSVTILPITKEKKIILVIEPRVFTKRTVGVEAPAGYVEDFERPIEAAERELLEETGLKSKEIIQLREYYCDMGSFAGITSSFIAKDCEKVSEQNLDEDEFIAIVECTIDEAKELIDMEYIKDINTIYLIENLEKFI
jgi:hydrolase, NUDIX family